MGQKNTIISLLQQNSIMTQSSLAEAMYGDNRHTPNIYSALVSLVNEGVVNKFGQHPARYSLNSAEIVLLDQKESTSKNKHRDVSNDLICNETLNEISTLVQETDNYGPENKLITRCLNKFPLNVDPDVVAMKIGLIDITNSTHLSQHKSLISMDELSHIIASIPDIDFRIEHGDPEVVNQIARSNGKINLFSFASKYCCYHNHNLYGQDDYSILDTILKEYLPRYFSDITKGKIQLWQNSFDYQSYNDFITNKLDELEITTPFRKRKFDHYVWFKNK